MLKTKLSYMALGALIASIGYFIGTLNNLNAEDEVARVKKLIVSEEIRVVNEHGVGTKITSGHVELSSNLGSKTLIAAGSIDLSSAASQKVLDKVKSDNKSEVQNILVDSIYNMLAPRISLTRAEGKKIIFQIDDEVSIKLTNGGIKSKTIAVD